MHGAKTLGCRAKGRKVNSNWAEKDHKRKSIHEGLISQDRQRKLNSEDDQPNISALWQGGALFVRLKGIAMDFNFSLRP